MYDSFALRYGPFPIRTIHFPPGTILLPWGTIDFPYGTIHFRILSQIPLHRNGLHLGKFEKRRPTFFQIDISLLQANPALNYKLEHFNKLKAGYKTNIAINLSGIAVHFTVYNEEFGGLKCILSRWNKPMKSDNIK